MENDKLEFESFSTRILVKTARENGFKAEKIFPESQRSLAKLKNRKGKEYLLVGQSIGLDKGAHLSCREKWITKKMLEKAGIRTPKGHLFEEGSTKEAIKFANKIGFPVVAKPNCGTWGRGVYIGIQNEKELFRYLKSLGQEPFLIEEQVYGEEYRVLATREKLLGIIKRIPANVEGDGISNIEDLIIKKNKDKKRGDSHKKSLVKIKIGKEEEEYLRSQGLSARSVPEKGKVVFLRKNSNLSTGGDSIDVTSKSHKDFQEFAPKIIRAIPGLPYGGFDLMINDISDSPYKSGCIIEINSSPMISMHEYPYRGEGRKVSKDIIDLFK